MYEEYKDKIFTEEGYTILLKYTQALIKEYIKKERLSYPFTLGIVLGVPYFREHYGNKFNCPEELNGRIQGYMQILMLNKIEFKDNKDIFYSFELPKVK